MKRTQKNNTRAGITQLPIIPGTLVLCGCTLLLFFGMLIAMYAGGMIPVPEFLSPLFSSEKSDRPDDGFASDFLASISGNAPPLNRENEELLRLTPDSLQQLLMAAEPRESYYQILDLTWTDGSSVFNRSEVHYVVSGDRVHAEIFPANALSRSVTCNETHIMIRENGVYRIFSRTEENAVFTPEAEAGIPSLSRMKEMLREAEEGKYTLSVETVENSPCIRAVFTDPLTGVQETFDVMPDYGLIIAASSTLPGSGLQYYQMSTSAILTDLSGLREDTFDIPIP